jgi:hypothetical protein
MARINEDGSPDTSFDDDGIATVNVAVGGKSGERASGMAVQSSDKVVLAGPVEHDPAAEGPALLDRSGPCAGRQRGLAVRPANSGVSDAA